MNSTSYMHDKGSKQLAKAEQKTKNLFLGDFVTTVKSNRTDYIT